MATCRGGHWRPWTQFYSIEIFCLVNNIYLSLILSVGILSHQGRITQAQKRVKFTFLEVLVFIFMANSWQCYHHRCRVVSLLAARLFQILSHYIHVSVTTSFWSFKRLHVTVVTQCCATSFSDSFHMTVRETIISLPSMSVVGWKLLRPAVVLPRGNWMLQLH